MATISLRERKAVQRMWPVWAHLVALLMTMYVLFAVYVLVTIQVPSKEHPFHQSQGTAMLQKIMGNHDGASLSNDFEYTFDSRKAELVLAKYGASSIRKILTAYIEPPMNDTVLGTGSQGDPKNNKDIGTPPEFVTPLPLRTNSPNDLLNFEYPKLQTCHDVPGKIPTDKGLQYDGKGTKILWNLKDAPKPDESPLKEALYCPVDADPYLPWIHDVFPSLDGTSIQFIAQNKRRCNTGSKFLKDLNRLEPQVALMQPVSVERLDEERARKLAPELWHPHKTTDYSTMPRYRLAPFNESATDGQSTRFICRFHATDFSAPGQALKTVVIGETLSTYPFNYEFVSYRKNRNIISSMLTPKGKDNRLLWVSTLQFECPVPQLKGLSELIASGGTILSDGTPTVHVDLIPIRTPPRYGPGEFYFPEGMIRPDNPSLFDPKARWGTRNVLPRVEASGRWENIPICFPPKVEVNANSVEKEAAIPSENAKSSSLVEKFKSKKKPHVLSACLWASASFRTRGAGSSPVTDTNRRLEEWLEFHFMAGFDHVYVFDNSGSQTNETSLAPLLDTYPKSKVTRIDWPSTVCNNNIPAHDNTGERSSQYAAENACRTRYGPFTEWIASFDTDEYLIPMGNYTSLKDVLSNAQKGGTNILTFRSSRAKLRHDHSRAEDGQRVMLDNVTFMDAFNCDSAPSPKPNWADRARKQVYRADYVKYHFVHYSTVTEGLLESYRENPKGWYHGYREAPPSERVTDEIHEAVMLHTKTSSSIWTERCHYQFEKKWRQCLIGFPWPNGTVVEGDGGHRRDGMEYNCFENERVSSYWGPRLREALAKRRVADSVNRTK